MSRVLIRANANLPDLARGEEVEVDYDQRTRQREANGLVSVLATTGEENTESPPRTGNLHAAQIVANSTVDDVVEWVGGNPDRALAARDAERARPNPRSTLLSQLDAVFSDQGET